jgi:hypothetical protein
MRNRNKVTVIDTRTKEEFYEIRPEVDESYSLKNFPSKL